MSDIDKCCRGCGLLVVGMRPFECWPSWEKITFSGKYASELKALSDSDQLGPWHGECLVNNAAGEQIAHMTLDVLIMRPNFIGSHEWGVSYSRKKRKQIRLMFDVVCAWPRYGALVSFTETRPPRGFARCFRTTAGEMRLLVLPMPWHVQPFFQVEVEIDLLRRIDAYTGVFVPKGADRVTEYAVAISEPFDQWLATADVPFEANSDFVPLRSSPNV